MVCFSGRKVSSIYQVLNVPSEGFRATDLEVPPGMNRGCAVLTPAFLPHTAGQLIMQQVNN